MLQGSTRIMPVCFSTGQAAGLAAALAVRAHVAPAKLDIPKLRAALTKARARID